MCVAMILLPWCRVCAPLINRMRRSKPRGDPHTPCRQHGCPGLASLRIAYSSCSQSYLAARICASSQGCVLQAIYQVACRLCSMQHSVTRRRHNDGHSARQLPAAHQHSQARGLQFCAGSGLQQGRQGLGETWARCSRVVSGSREDCLVYGGLSWHDGVHGRDACKGSVRRHTIEHRNGKSSGSAACHARCASSTQHPHRLVFSPARQCAHGEAFRSGWDNRRCGSDDDDDQSPRVEVEQRPPDGNRRAPAVHAAVPAAAAQATTPDPAAEADTAPVNFVLAALAEQPGDVTASEVPLGQLPSPEQRAVVVVKTEQLLEPAAAAVPPQHGTAAIPSSPPQSKDVAGRPRSRSPTAPDSYASWWGSAVYAACARESCCGSCSLSASMQVMHVWSDDAARSTSPSCAVSDELHAFCATGGNAGRALRQSTQRSSAAWSSASLPQAWTARRCRPRGSCGWSWTKAWTSAALLDPTSATVPHTKGSTTQQQQTRSPCEKMHLLRRSASRRKMSLYLLPLCAFWQLPGEMLSRWPPQRLPRLQRRQKLSLGPQACGRLHSAVFAHCWQRGGIADGAPRSKHNPSKQPRHDHMMSLLMQHGLLRSNHMMTGKTRTHASASHQRSWLQLSCKQISTPLSPRRLYPTALHQYSLC